MQILHDGIAYQYIILSFICFYHFSSRELDLIWTSQLQMFKIKPCILLSS